MHFGTRALAAFFTFAGAMHFLRPRTYQAIMPDYPVQRHRRSASWMTNSAPTGLFWGATATEPDNAQNVH